MIKAPVNSSELDRIASTFEMGQRHIRFPILVALSKGQNEQMFLIYQGEIRPFCQVMVY